MTERRKGGRNPKLDPAVNRYCVRFTGEENKRLLAMFKQSGMPYMACFIKTQFFGQEFRTFTDDGSMKPYNDKLASLHSQFRQLGNDYNLALKELKVSCHPVATSYGEIPYADGRGHGQGKVSDGRGQE